MSSLLPVTTGFAGRKCRLDHDAGRIDPADQLHHDVDRGSVAKTLRVPGDKRIGDPRAMTLEGSATATPTSSRRTPSPSRDPLGVLHEHPAESAADVAGSEHSDAHGLAGPPGSSSVKASAAHRAQLAFGLSPSGLVVGDEVVERLAAHDDPGGAVAYENDCRAGDLVVVGSHRVAVGAGDRGCEDVPHRAGPAGTRASAHDDIPGLAVLAHDGDRSRPRAPGASRRRRPRSRSRKAPAAGCRSSRRRRTT